MRIINIAVYKFDELGEGAKEKARDWFRQGMGDSFAFETVIEDAKNICLRITSLDSTRANQGEFVTDAKGTAEAILANHGPSCETYKTAETYLPSLKSEDEETAENSAHEFLHDLLEDYRVMLDKEIEYLYSNESVDENIRINEYEFTEKGEILK